MVQADPLDDALRARGASQHDWHFADGRNGERSCAVAGGGGALLAGPEGLGTIQFSGGLLVPQLLARDDGIDWLLAHGRLVGALVRSAAAKDQQRIRAELDALAHRRPTDAEALRNSWFPTPK